jgi:DNA-binding CsgD family transcriptional regulator
MLHTQSSMPTFPATALDQVPTYPAAIEPPAATFDLLLSVLESAELAVVVADPSGRALYMNAAARATVSSPLGVMPPWLAGALPGLRHQLARQPQAVERVVHGDLTLRVRARTLSRPGMVLMELAVASGSAGRQVAEQLARGLGLAITDARLLALLWRGLSNEEIAQALGVRTGTIKSRLFRLYHRLGVKKRPAAVLRAQEVLAA